jgi:hypothetical protein
MTRQLSVVAAGVIGTVVAGAAMVASANAGETALSPEEAKRFVANKFFSYSCFDGTNGAGRIHSDGSVVGTMQTGNGPVRFVSLPSGTIRLSTDSICAALPHSLIQPCFSVVQTSPQSWRGSLRGLGFAHCDFVRRNPRQEVTETQRPRSRAIESAIALRPSRY